MRLNSYLSKCGISSRRGAEIFVTSGRVFVNNALTTRIIDINPDKDIVAVDGASVTPKPTYYFALHKPNKYLCSNRRQDTRKIVIELFDPSLPRLYTVGRLDYDSTGLIIVTNDGHFAHILMHPKHGIEKEYIVECEQIIQSEFLIRYLCPDRHRSSRYSIQSVRVISPKVVSIVLTEGKNREIRKIMAAGDYTVRKLHRIRIGKINLREIPVGKYRPLTQSEINYILAQ